MMDAEQQSTQEKRLTREDIAALDTHEKSILLARAAGWHAVSNTYKRPGFGLCWVIHTGDEEPLWHTFLLMEEEAEDPAFEHLMPDLYRPHNMATAWRILQWANETLREHGFEVPSSWLKMDAGDAIQTWLDTAFSHATDAGLIPDDPTSADGT